MSGDKSGPLSPAPPNPTSKHSAFSALRHRDFRLLWMGQLVSVTGSQMQLVAINWHIWLLTKSPLALGGVGLVRITPIILCSLIGGAVADVFDRKRLMIVTQSVMLASAAALALITANGLHSIWPIYGLTALASAASAFDGPARQSLLPALVPIDEFTNAVSLGQVVFQVAMIAGPALSGFLLETHTPAIVYGINSISYLAVIIAIGLIRTSGTHSLGKGAGPRVSVESIREGLMFVWRTPIIVQTMTLDFIATFFGSATTLLPIFADVVLKVGARGLGFLASAPALGSLGAGLVMARIRSVRKQGPVVIVAICAYGVATICFGLSHVFWLSLLTLACVGASDTVSTVLRQTIRQLVTPDYLRGRMTSVNMIFFMGGPQLGELEAGTVAKFIGAPLSVITGGIGCVIAVAIAALNATNLRHYDTHLSHLPGAAVAPQEK
ncbi:MAG TPA: MFS transporter [Blastocatellia bacterium]|nr:MFS transporter [Blastocatellia bacterium]